MQAAWADYYGAVVPVKLAGNIRAIGPAVESFAVGLAGGLFTFFLSLTLCGLTSFRRPLAVNALCLAALAEYAFLAWTFRRGLWRLPLGLCGGLALAAGLPLGRHCYARYGYFAQIYGGARLYGNVDPYQPAASVADAGRLVFAAEAHVNVSASAGFLGEDGVMYCAAPVFGLDPPRRVSFWAVGTDCCEAAGGFACGAAAALRSARSGAVLFGGPGGHGGGPLGLLNGWLGHSPGPRAADAALRALFTPSLQKAEEALGLTSQDGGDDSVLVRWMDEQELRLLARGYTMEAWVFILLSTFLFACVLAPVAWAVGRYAGAAFTQEGVWSKPPSRW